MSYYSLFFMKNNTPITEVEGWGLAVYGKVAPESIKNPLIFFKLNDVLFSPDVR